MDSVNLSVLKTLFEWQKTELPSWLVTVVDTLGGFDLAQFPRILEYLARIAVRPAVKSAMKSEGLIQ